MKIILRGVEVHSFKPACCKNQDLAVIPYSFWVIEKWFQPFQRNYFPKKFHLRYLICSTVQNIYSTVHIYYRNNLPEVFCKKGVLRNASKFPGKHLCQASKKRDLDTGVFLCILWNFQEYLFYRTHVMAASGNENLWDHKEKQIQ